MAQRIVDHTITPEQLEKQSKSKAVKTAKVNEQEIKSESSKKTAKASKQKKTRGEKYKTARKNVDKERVYEIAEAIKQIRNIAFAKFNEAVELHFNLEVDPKNANQRIRFTTALPYGTGKSLSILVISDDNSGQKDNINYRDKSAVDEIVDGKLVPGRHFDVIIVTPSAMKDLAKAARILGPRGMMPSPKTGTVTDKIDTALSSMAKGQIEIKTQPGHTVLHQSVGKLSFKDEELEQNIKHLINEIKTNGPTNKKGSLIKKIYMASTMSPSIRISS